MLVVKFESEKGKLGSVWWWSKGTVCGSLFHKGSADDFFHATEEKFVESNEVDIENLMRSSMNTKYDNMTTWVGYKFYTNKVSSLY